MHLSHSLPFHSKQQIFVYGITMVEYTAYETENNFIFTPLYIQSEFLLIQFKLSTTLCLLLLYVSSNIAGTLSLSQGTLRCLVLQRKGKIVHTHTHNWLKMPRLLYFMEKGHTVIILLCVWRNYIERIFHSIYNIKGKLLWRYMGNF